MLLQINTNYSTTDFMIKNLFEYREQTGGFSVQTGLKHSPLRSNAISKGDLFILLFRVQDVNSFCYVKEIRDSIVERRGASVPLLFIGISSDLSNNTTVRATYRDFISSVWESSYREITLKHYSCFVRLHQDIVLHKCKASTHRYQKNQIREKSICIREKISKLFVNKT